MARQSKAQTVSAMHTGRHYMSRAATYHRWQHHMTHCRHDEQAQTTKQPMIMQYSTRGESHPPE